MPSRLVAVSARICVSPAALVDAARRLRVRPARALQEHERLQPVRVHARGLRRPLDRRAVARDPLRGDRRAARRARVEQVAGARRGAAGEVGGALLASRRTGPPRPCRARRPAGSGRAGRSSSSSASGRRTSAMPAQAASTASDQRDAEAEHLALGWQRCSGSPFWPGGWSASTSPQRARTRSRSSRDICGLHAQVMSSAQLTLWARVEDPPDVEDAAVGAERAGEDVGDARHAAPAARRRAAALRRRAGRPASPATSRTVVAASTSGSRPRGGQSILAEVPRRCATARSPARS